MDISWIDTLVSSKVSQNSRILFPQLFGVEMVHQKATKQVGIKRETEMETQKHPLFSPFH